MHLGNNHAPLLPKTILVKVTKKQIRNLEWVVTLGLH